MLEKKVMLARDGDDFRFPPLIGGNMATLSAVCLLVIGATAADAAPPTTQQVQAGAGLGLRNLTSEGRAWIEDRKCASCHHVPMMVWALAEAQRAAKK